MELSGIGIDKMELSGIGIDKMELNGIGIDKMELSGIGIDKMELTPCLVDNLLATDLVGISQLSDIPTFCTNGLRQAKFFNYLSFGEKWLRRYYAAFQHNCFSFLSLYCIWSCPCSDPNFYVCCR